MNRGLYIATTSMVNNQRRMDVLSNNLANVNTTGFKKDFSVSESFPEKLFAKRNRVGEVRRPLVENNLSFENENGLYKAKINEGFFRVETPGGISHLKEIRFVEDEGYLKTSFKRLDDERTSLGENYILDRAGNRVRAGNISQATMEDLVYEPRGYVIGTMSGGVNFKRAFTDFSQGGIVDTGSRLDLALMGQGLFKVQTENGIRYTRDGNFDINANNQLVNMEGQAVLSQTNSPISIPNGDLNISENGVISVDGQVIARLGVDRVVNSEALIKVGDNNYEAMLGEDGQPIALQIEAFDGKVLQGYIESSNVNPVDSMVEMISLLREYEASQKVIRTEDEILEKAATEIAKL